MSHREGRKYVLCVLEYPPAASSPVGTTADTIGVRARFLRPTSKEGYGVTIFDRLTVQIETRMYQPQLREMVMPHVLDPEITAFEDHIAELRVHHMGKFVVFHGGELHGAYDTFDTAFRAATQKFGSTPFLVRQVGAESSFPIPASVAYRPVHAHR